MTPTVKRVLLGCVLVATLGAAWYAPEEEVVSAAVAPARGAGTIARAPMASFVDVLPIRARSGDDGVEASLFASTEWGGAPVAAPVAAAPVVAAPVEATAPPLPFRVMGSFQQAGQTVVFLQQNDLNHAVRSGDTIGETYKVEAIDGAVMTLRYLPLDQVQTLELGRTLQDKRESE